MHMGLRWFLWSLNLIGQRWCTQKTILLPNIYFIRYSLAFVLHIPYLSVYCYITLEYSIHIQISPTFVFQGSLQVLSEQLGFHESKEKRNIKKTHNTWSLGMAFNFLSKQESEIFQPWKDRRPFLSKNSIKTVGQTGRGRDTEILAKHGSTSVAWAAWDLLTISSSAVTSETDAW